MNQFSTRMTASFICNTRPLTDAVCAVLVALCCLTTAAHGSDVEDGCRESFTDHANTILACNVVIASPSISIPRLIRALQIRAQAFLSTGRPEEAVADYSNAIEKLPVGQLQGYILYLRGRIRVRYIPGQLEQGTHDLELANAQAPANTRILEALAEVYLAMEQPLETIRVASQAIETDARSVIARKSRARAYDQLGKSHLALKDLNALLLQTPHNYDLIFWRGRIHQKRNNIYSALADFRNAVRIQSSDALSERIQELERLLR